jgi:branched-chain amino acid transport system substrate-binding protein
MLAEALTTEMAKNPKLKKLFIIGQNYPLGQAISKATREMMKRKRPDVEIVGDDLHPIGQVKDFAPYIAKIKASGADAVTTANWGVDLTLLIKAANDAGLQVPFYTYYAHSLGVPTALGPAAAGRVQNISVFSPNSESSTAKEMEEGMKAKYHSDFIISGTYTLITALAAGIKKAGSTDPVNVAYALEGVRFKDVNGESEMRKVDHQLLSNTFVSGWAKVDGKDVKYDQENTGYGWKLEHKIDAYVSALPTSCQMERPALR